MQKTIELNGNTYDMPTDVGNVQQLLTHLDLGERILSVEMNKEILAKKMRAIKTAIKSKSFTR